MNTNFRGGAGKYRYIDINGRKVTALADEYKAPENILSAGMHRKMNLECTSTEFKPINILTLRVVYFWNKNAKFEKMDLIYLFNVNINRIDIADFADKKDLAGWKESGYEKGYFSYNGRGGFMDDIIAQDPGNQDSIIVGQISFNPKIPMSWFHLRGHRWFGGVL